MATLRGHERNIFAALFSPDGNLIATPTTRATDGLTQPSDSIQIPVWRAAAPHSSSMAGCLAGGTIPVGDSFDLDSTPGTIGKWVCRGTWNFSPEEVLNGATPHVSTTQHYLFDAVNSLMSEGPEGSHEAINRVVLGGTGRFRGFVGEVQEQFLGYNITGLENFRFTFKIRKAR